MPFPPRPAPGTPLVPSAPPPSAAKASASGTPAPTEVDVLLAETGGWSPITIERGSEPVDGSLDDRGRLRKRIVGHLQEVQLSEHLMVVSGLGTSLCVLDKDGGRPAPTMWELWSAVKATTNEAFDEVISLVKHTAGEDIEALLSRCHLFQFLTPDSKVETFITSAEAVIRDLCEAIIKKANGFPHHEAFLLRLTSRPTRLPRFKVFTTNYDLCFEQAASRIKAVVVDGFTHSNPQEFDGACFSYDVVLRRDAREVPEFIPNVFQLYKLHGSVDWKDDDGRITKGRGTRPVMIYPRDSKYQLSYSQPFLEMMARFQEALRTPNTGIIISGFGFNDDHLAQPIISAIRSNSSLRVVIVDPGLKAPATGKQGSKHLKFVEGLVAAGDKRIALVNGTFENLASMMPEASVVPEAETHRQRMNRVDRK